MRQYLKRNERKFKPGSFVENFKKSAGSDQLQELISGKFKTLFSGKNITPELVLSDINLETV